MSNCYENRIAALEDELSRERDRADRLNATRIEDGLLIARLEEQNKLLRKALEAARESARLGPWEDCESDDCRTCVAHRRAVDLRDKALAQKEGE